MTEQGPLEPPRIALVFGDEAAAAHVREAIDGHVHIVYATAAGEFNAAHLASTGATAALVNLDGGAWPDPADAKWHDAGVPVVFNDAEASRELEGWNRARWSRHLVAKLTGSADFDPPRPVEVPDRVATEAADAHAHPAPDVPAAGAEPTSVIDRPLSVAEIEAMTVDFVAGRDTAAAAAVVEGVASAEPEPPSAVPEPDRDRSSAPAVPAPGDDLDVDTEALSAMIDARLAEPQAPVPADSSEVWRIVEDEVPSTLEPAAADVDAASAGAAPVPADDTDVYASLPSLDDWQLVDPEEQQVASSGPRAPAGTEPALPDLAGLELVPMDLPETRATQHEEPIERWLDDSSSVSAATRGAKRSGTDGDAR